MASTLGTGLLAWDWTWRLLVLVMILFAALPLSHALSRAAADAGDQERDDEVKVKLAD